MYYPKIKQLSFVALVVATIPVFDDCFILL